MKAVPLYDDFAADYDRFVNWEARLAFELPFFLRLLEEHHARRVLDVACGTGQHALALARAGYTVTATDLSAAMVERARANAATAGVGVDVRQLGFGELSARLHTPYDALLCLGNSLPHVTTDAALDAALADFAQVLAPGGIAILQNRNFDRVLAKQERFMPPEVHAADVEEWVFVRFYDFDGDLLRFNVVRLHRQGTAWSARLGQTLLRAWRAELLQARLTAAGLTVAGIYGSYRGEAFDPLASGDLVLVAQRRE